MKIALPLLVSNASVDEERRALGASSGDGIRTLARERKVNFMTKECLELKQKKVGFNFSPRIKLVQDPIS
jgi:hypothetical protein